MLTVAIQMNFKILGMLSSIETIATANPGCMLQIRAGAVRQLQTWSVVHPIELLDAAIRGKGVDEV